jgi:hypothetical protein
MLGCSFRPPFLLLAISLGVATLAGCNRGPAVAQVKGQVLNLDGSVPRGAVRVVRFEPLSENTAEIRKAASGDIDPNDGSFELYTRRPGDGVYLGDYAVTFAVLSDPHDMNSSLIADKYTNSKATPYHVTVDGDVDDLKFEIEPIAP